MRLFCYRLCGGGDESDDTPTPVTEETPAPETEPEETTGGYEPQPLTPDGNMSLVDDITGERPATSSLSPSLPKVATIFTSSLTAPEERAVILPRKVLRALACINELLKKFFGTLIVIPENINIIASGLRLTVSARGIFPFPVKQRGKCLFIQNSYTRLLGFGEF